MYPTLVYEDGIIRYTVYVTYDRAIRNTILQARRKDSLEILMREYRGDSHCISYCIYEYSKLIYNWMRGEN